MIPNLVIIAIVGSVVILVFAIGYITMLLSSHRKIIHAQRTKLDEVTQSEKKYSDLFNHSLVGMMKFSLENWQILDANRALKQIFGCTTEGELANCFMRLPTRSVQVIQQALLSSNIIQDYEIRTVRLDGGEMWILFSAKMIGEAHIAHGVIVDITERKSSADRITEQAMLLDEAQDAIMVTDYQGRVTFWNSGAKLIYGWDKEHAVGTSLCDLVFDISHSQEFHLAMEDIHQFNEWSGEQHHVNRDRKELLIQSRWKKVENTSTGRKTILIVNTDITEKRRQEIRMLRAQKMESIALLTGGIAHDLQNVLAPIAMSVNLLRDKITDNPGTKVLNAVEESARSGLDLVRNIIAYGHGVPGERAEVELSDLLDSVMMIVRQSMPETIRLEKSFEDRRYIVIGDVNQLKQVFLNIAVNARDAMPADGILTIGIDTIVVDDNSIDWYLEAQMGTYYEVSISDNGHGISEDQIERIFEPFYTTKTNGNGTGIGLSIALGIVKSHAGFITVQSVVNKGTTFKIFLPTLETYRNITER